MFAYLTGLSHLVLVCYVSVCSLGWLAYKHNVYCLSYMYLELTNEPGCCFYMYMLCHLNVATVATMFLKDEGLWVFK